MRGSMDLQRALLRYFGAVVVKSGKIHRGSVENKQNSSKYFGR